MSSLISISLALAASPLLVQARLPIVERRDAGTLEHKKLVKSELVSLISKIMPGVTIFKRQDDEQCVEDDWFGSVAQLPPAIVTPLCQNLLGIVPITSTVTIVPTTTARLTSTTRSRPTTVTVLPPAHTTVTVTATTTAAVLRKRNSTVDGIFQDLAKRQKVDATVAISAFASVCRNCLDGLAAVETVTSTAATATKTVRIGQPIVSTVEVTGSAPEFTTVTSFVTVQPDVMIATISYHGPPATPTAAPIVCPDDDGSDTTQIVHGRIYDYYIGCAADLLDENLAERSYSSFTECVSACSLVNDGVDGAACLAVSYIAAITNGSSNCFLKRSAFLEVSNNDGSSIAILSRVGIPSAVDPEVLPANSEPFASSTSVENVDTIIPSTSAIPVVTPAPVQSSVTTASIDESKTITGSISTALGNSSWVNSYYSTASDAWGSPSPVALATSSEVATSGIAASSTTGTSSQSQLAGSGAILRNQTVIVNGAGYSEVTQYLRYIYPNGTVIDQVLVTTSGSRAPNDVGSIGSGSGGSFSDSSTSTNATISETTSIVVIIRQTSISSSSNNRSGSSYTIGGNGGQYATTTIYDTTTYETNSAASTAMPTSTSKTVTMDPATTSSPPFTNTSTSISSTSDTTNIVTTSPPFNTSSTGSTSSGSMSMTGENRTFTPFSPTLSSTTHKKTRSSFPPLPTGYSTYYPPNHPSHSTNSSRIVGSTSIRSTSATPYPLSNSSSATSVGPAGTSQPIATSRNITFSPTRTSDDRSFTPITTTLASNSTNSAVPSTPSSNYTIPYSTGSSAISPITTACATVTVGGVTVTQMQTVTVTAAGWKSWHGRRHGKQSYGWKDSGKNDEDDNADGSDESDDGQGGN